MKDILVACPHCKFPINVTEAILKSQQSLNEVVLDGNSIFHVTCDMCNEKTIEVSIREIEKKGPIKKQSNDNEKLIN